MVNRRFSSYTKLYACISALKVKTKRQRRSYLTDLINSVVEIIIILFQAVIIFLLPWGRLIERVCTWFMIKFMCMWVYGCLLLPFSSSSSFGSLVYTLMNTQYSCIEGKRRRQERKITVISTRIISTSINQVDSLFSLSLYGTILSVFLNMQAREVTSCQKSMTRHWHMPIYS